MSAELFLELGTEELPAGFIPRALKDLEDLFRQELDNARIAFGEIHTFATPRRLAISIQNVAAKQQRQELEITGPPARIAYDESGNPTKAAQGFARTNGVSVDELKTINTGKGEYLQISKVIEGGETRAELPVMLPRIIGRLSFKKSMRWKDLEVRFARPMHWIAALYDSEVIPFSYGELNSGNLSRGHRFMAPEEFQISGMADYLPQAEKHYVLPEINKRRHLIKEQLEQLAERFGGRINPDEELLDEVSFLVEFPQALAGNIDERFLQLPDELLITSMREHQRYFTLVNSKDELMPHFITIANTQAADPQIVVAGNERVLKARLADAMFFWQEDQKSALEDRLEPLKKVVYQAKLGTSYEKIERFSELAAGLAEKLAPEDVELTKRAARLAKCDLETGMVYEFPELQGVMGREYALLEGEDKRVAKAIYEHYLPIQAGGDLPSDNIGAFVSLADKIDTICGCFSVGLIPSGTADPYALRRNAIGILAIILDRDYPVSIPALVSQSVELLKAKHLRPADQIVEDVCEFIRLRLTNMLTGQGYAGDIVDAVLAAGFSEPVEAVKRIRALSVLKERPDFEALKVAFKRIGNIIKGGLDLPVDENLFIEDCEKELYSELQRVKNSVEKLTGSRDYLQALEVIAGLREPVDAFFDGVMVMAEDETIKNNRLALLTDIAGLFKDIADFSRLA